MQFKRTSKLLKTNSFFLFGARGTGKSTLVHEILLQNQSQVVNIDLLERSIVDRYSRDPDTLYDELKVAGNIEWVIIDEVQRVPELLNTVHRVLENREFTPPKFALTGSSARKLKHGNANLLAGRAFVNHLFPLTFEELGSQFVLNDILNVGSLPKLYSLTTMEERKEYLRSYALMYLSEEVWAEHLIQKLEPFRAFLEVAAQMNGELIQYSNIARDVGVDEKTVKKYFEILADTHMGFFLEPYHRSVRKRQLQSSKFYFFDLGVVRALARALTFDITPQTTEYGDAFEHFIIAELHRLNHYRRRDYRFSFIRTKDDSEIDVIIERPAKPTALIEVKSKKKTTDDDAKHLRAFSKDFPKAELYVLSQDDSNRISDGISFFHWRKGIEHLGLVETST